MPLLCYSFAIAFPHDEHTPCPCRYPCWQLLHLPMIAWSFFLYAIAQLLWYGLPSIIVFSAAYTDLPHHTHFSPIVLLLLIEWTTGVKREGGVELSGGRVGMGVLLRGWGGVGFRGARRGPRGVLDALSLEGRSEMTVFSLDPPSPCTPSDPSSSNVG